MTDHLDYCFRDLLYRVRQQEDAKTCCSFSYAKGSKTDKCEKKKPINKYRAELK